MATATKAPKAKKSSTCQSNEVKNQTKNQAKAQTMAKDECCDSLNFQPTYGTICHVEFTAPNLDAAKTFYGGLFGWEFQSFSENEWFFQATGNGPCGCIMKGNASTDAKTLVYVNVDDLNTTLKKAQNLGAKTVKPRTEIPGGHGYFAQLRAPEGNVLGIYSRNG